MTQMKHHTSNMDAIIAAIVMIGVAIVCIVNPVSAATDITSCRADIVSIGDVENVRADGTSERVIPMGQTISIVSIDQNDQRVITNATCQRPGDIIRVVIIGRIQSQAQKNGQATVPVIEPTVVPTPTTTTTTTTPTIQPTVMPTPVPTEEVCHDNRDGCKKPKKNK